MTDNPLDRKNVTCAGCGRDGNVRTHIPEPWLCFLCRTTEPTTQGDETMAAKKKKKAKGIPAVSGEAPDTNGKGAEAATAGPPDRARIERRRYKEKLPCAIPPEEVVFKADEMAVVYRKVEALKEEKRNALADFRDRKAQLEENLGDLATAVEQHTISREVDVVEYLIDGTGTIEVVRQDTLEVVIVKAATSEDLQERIFDKIDEANAAAAKGPERKDSELMPAIFSDEIAEKDAALAADGDVPDWEEGANPKSKTVTFDKEARARLRADKEART